eukprot:gnl/TRDRNA2_/TRDRNA2_190092_c0_seq1.p1 gnl/TRDRNA2_/TRDRNA2_190092_c0~~gnl/TRDRNA2_/TRDRNA2_190092_c0_seq1.p1  ORF type:complete len:301 (+),score=30.95 gnl/TRDRNA2_/TRDRNA2_190092_c0_seq1:74-976(+)
MGDCTSREPQPPDAVAPSKIMEGAGLVFAVCNFSWFTVSDFLQVFHAAVPPHNRELLIYVPTAVDCSAADRARLAEERRRRLGFKTVTVFDFQSRNTMEASRLFEGVGREACIYLEGGNPFTLRHFARPFDDIFRHAVMFKGVSCIGVSAGLLLATATVETGLWKGLDNPHPPSVPTVDWQDPAESMGWDILGGMAFFCHYSPQWGETVNREEGRWQSKYPLMTIDDVTLLVFKAGSARPVDVVTSSPALQPSAYPVTPRIYSRGPRADSMSESTLPGKPVSFAIASSPRHPRAVSYGGM